MGEAADLFASERRKGKVTPMGVVDMEAGNNQLMFKLVGKNDQSTGLGFDLARIICEKVE
jgi:hypothetical protein